MSEFVEMVHPKLPGRVIKVRTAKTGPREAGGWKLKTPEGKPSVKATNTKEGN